jgi:hypothetical protein
MSSYSEFKSDVKNIAGGVVVAIILGALIQLTAVLIMLGVALLIIPIARLLGVSADKISAIKSGIVYGVGFGIVISFFIYMMSIIFSSPAFQTNEPITPQQEQEWKDFRIKNNPNWNEEEYQKYLNRK